MKNLNDLFEKYPRVYPALHKTIIGKGISVDDAEDILHDLILQLNEKIDWTKEEDASILSFIYKGLNFYLMNKGNALKKTHYIYCGRAIERQRLYVEDKDGEEKPLEIIDKKDHYARYSLIEDMRLLLNNDSISGKFRSLIEYYIEAIERNATEDDFRQSDIAEAIGVTRQYVEKVRDKFADYLRSYRPVGAKVGV